MKNSACCLLLLAFLTSCKKDDKKHTVLYKITVIAGHPSFSVSYSSSGNSTASQGPFSTATWTSPSINDRKGGGSVFLTLGGGTGGSYYMYIYIDGSLAKTGRMDDPYGPMTISAEIPED